MIPRKKASLFTVLLVILGGAIPLSVWATNETIKLPNGLVMEVSVPCDNAFRVVIKPENSVLTKSEVLLTKEAIVSYTRSESNNGFILQAKEARLEINKRDFALTLYDKSGKVVAKEVISKRLCTPTEVRGEHTLLTQVGFETANDEYIFGLGQFQDGLLNLRGVTRRLTQVNTQIALPYYYSSKGYSVLWLNTGLTNYNPANAKVLLNDRSVEAVSQIVEVTSTEGTVKEKRTLGVFKGKFPVHQAGNYAILLDVGRKMARKHYVEIDGKPVIDMTNYWLPPTAAVNVQLSEGEHTVVVKGEASDDPVVFYKEVEPMSVFSSPVSEAIDMVLFAGSADACIASYRQMTGAAPMPPLWALGYIHCRERYNTQQELLENAKEFRDRNIPLDLIVQDWMYWGKLHWNAMQFDSDNYPNPKGMVDSLHNMNMRLMVSVWSKIDPKSVAGKQFASENLYIPNTSWVDFFNPKARELYWSYFTNGLVSKGIDAWWQDATEPENDDLLGRDTYAGKGEKVRLIYPMMVNKTVYEGLRHDQPLKRPFILTRSAFLGQQRYGTATWSGDVGSGWKDFKYQIPAGLNLCITGQPYWTTDAGGFFRPEKEQYTDANFQEIFLRWMQFSTFSPLMRNHGYKSKTEMWRYSGNTMAVSQQYIKLRYRLLPYIYSQAANITFNHSTIMRPLVMDFAHDPKAMQQSFSYMFGPAFLVSPVTESKPKSWKVYLPNGTQWYDFWTGTRYEGGRTVEAAAPIEQIPLFVKAGSIVPMAIGDQQYAQTAKQQEIRIYEGANGEFTLYEDAATTNAYEQGEYTKTELHWDNRNKILRIDDRRGTFKGMTNRYEFNIVLVSESNGKGDLWNDNAPSKKIIYKGKATTVKL